MVYRIIKPLQLALIVCFDKWLAKKRLTKNRSTVAIEHSIFVSHEIQLIMKENKIKIIKMYQRNDGDCPVLSWLESLDHSIRYRIKARLARVSLGNFGEYKILGDGISELKFKFGSGYRIYYGEVDGAIILLLCGGDKKTQKQDIKMAKKYLNDYLQGDIDA